MQVLSTLFLLIGLLDVNQTSLFFHPGDREANHDNWEVLSDSSSVDWKQSYWVKLHINAKAPGGYVIQGGKWYMESMNFYDESYHQIATGNRITVFLSTRDTTFYIYYPFVDQKTNKKFVITVESETEFIVRNRRNDLFQTGFLSIIGFVLLVNIFLAIRSKDRVYVYYGFYLFSLFYFFAYQFGVLSWILPFVVWIPPALVWISSASLSIAYALFAISFLDLKRTDQLAFHVMRFAVYYILFVILVECVTYLFDYDIQHKLYYKILVFSIQVPLILIYMYRIFMMRNILSYIFFVGAVILMICTLSAQYISTLQKAFETNETIQAGLLLDIFVFSFGIAVRVGLINREREKTQSQLIEQLQINEKLQEEYTDELERKVLSRTAQLEKKNKENETLLREIHHRVKNNLQMISSLLNIQARRIKNPLTQEVLLLTKNRIISIGMIHEHLYSNDCLSKFILKVYVEDLIGMIRRNLVAHKNLKLKLEVQEIEVDFDLAIIVGLVLNELVTNSFKYAFINHPEPKLTIQISLENDSMVILVADNGPGIKNPPSGFGWSIMQAILENARGNIQYENKNGLQVKVQISL